MSGLTRPYYFAKHLNNDNYSNIVFSSAYLHYSNENIIKNNEKFIIHQENNVPFVFLRTPKYKRNKLDRVLNIICFMLRLFSVTKTIARQVGKPDTIIASSPHLLTLIAGIKIAKRYKVPCICEVRDLWPESIFVHGSLKKHSLLGKLLLVIEKWIYRKATKIIFTMPGGYDYITDQCWDKIIPKNKCFSINNGIDLEEFDYNKSHHTISDEDLSYDDTFKVVYAGSIRKVNNLRIMIDVARELRDNNKIKFLIWGGGNELEELRIIVESESLTNIVFKGYIKRQYIPYILSKSDISLSHYKDVTIYRYGTSQNKSFEYLASGKPVLYTFMPKYDIISETNSGMTIEKQTTENIKNAITAFFDIAQHNKELYDEMCRNARNTAERYDYRTLSKKLVEIIES